MEQSKIIDTLETYHACIPVWTYRFVCTDNTLVCTRSEIRNRRGWNDNAPGVSTLIIRPSGIVGATMHLSSLISMLARPASLQRQCSWCVSVAIRYLTARPVWWISSITLTTTPPPLLPTHAPNSNLSEASGIASSTWRRLWTGKSLMVQAVSCIFLDDPFCASVYEALSLLPVHSWS